MPQDQEYTKFIQGMYKLIEGVRNEGGFGEVNFKVTLVGGKIVSTLLSKTTTVKPV